MPPSSPRLSLPLSVVAIAVPLLFCSGCDHSASPAVPAITMASADAAPAIDSGKGSGYVFRIVYPALDPDWRTLDTAIRAYASAAKTNLLETRAADPAVKEASERRLDLEFSIARRTSDFVSVLAKGSIDTGGAHPMPLLASFNLHIGDDRMIALSDLFADADAALRVLSDESRRQLKGRYDATPHDTMTEKQRVADRQQMYAWIERGTEPKPDNFKLFFIDGLDAKGIGLTVIFPPYQVASYADGPQQLEVPAKIFYAFLKPEYRDAFQIDAEAQQIAPGVR